MFSVLSLLLSLMIFRPGQIVPDKIIDSQGIDTFFSVNEIPDDIFHMMQGLSYKDDCVVPADSLKYVLCLHRDAKGKAIVGEMVVSRRIADRLLNILKELFRASYPIERMRLVDYWQADDEKSMTANNSSSFNFRFISHTSIVSKHGSGLAVDINPLYNPYIKTLNDGSTLIEPAKAVRYTDRTLKNPYMIKDGDLCCRLFKENGFEWGGDWKTCKDYQHFEFPE